jgi:hypothetical protein
MPVCLGSFRIDGRITAPTISSLDKTKFLPFYGVKRMLRPIAIEHVARRVESVAEGKAWGGAPVELLHGKGALTQQAFTYTIIDG